jgi:transposase-like protein
VGLLFEQLPRQRTKFRIVPHSTNPLERLNKEIKRRNNVIGIFPNSEAVIRLVGALMLEQNDEWAFSRRYMPVEKLTAMCNDQDAATMIAAQ